MIRLLVLASAIAFTTAATAMPLPSPQGNDVIVKIADGCGQQRYRGPGGACHFFGTGPYPDGYYEAQQPVAANGCPPGYWRGPWGHCRDTPFHGRLPNGSWQ